MEDKVIYETQGGYIQSNQKTANDFLIEASSIMSERGKDYDKEQERSMGKTIQAFNAITGLELSEHHGWLLMSLLKKVRQYSSDSFHYDSALDDIAYAALFAECKNNES